LCSQSGRVRSTKRRRSSSISVSNPDQLKISLEFEKRSKATEQAISELMSDKLEFRYKEAEEKKDPIA
jgi:hypothetical protein